MLRCFCVAIAARVQASCLPLMRNAWHSPGKTAGPAPPLLRADHAVHPMLHPVTLQLKGRHPCTVPHTQLQHLYSAISKQQVLCALPMQMVEEFLAQPQARHGTAQSSVPDQWADQFGAEGYGASEWADQFANQLAAGTDVDSWMEDFAKEMDEQVAAQRGEPLLLQEATSQQRGEPPLSKEASP